MDVTIDSKVIGQRLQKIRKSKGLTQAEMATHLNLQTSSYGNFERGSEMPSLKKGHYSKVSGNPIIMV